MESIISQLELDTDSDFSELLTQGKHAENILLPPVFRIFLLQLKPFRWDLSRGIKYKAGKLTFFFFISEFGTYGSPEQVFKNITSLLQANGFSLPSSKLNEYGYPEHIYEMEQDTLVHKIILIGPERFVGSKDARCGGSITYNIEYKKQVKSITTENLLDAYPQLKCSELPHDLLNYFAKEKVFSLSYGGTWQRYYSWGIRIQHPDRLLAEKQFQEVEEILTKIGFFFDHESRGVSVFYKFKEHDPIIYISLEENNIFYFRIQPHT